MDPSLQKKKKKKKTSPKKNNIVNTECRSGPQKNHF